MLDNSLILDLLQLPQRDLATLARVSKATRQAAHEAMCSQGISLRVTPATQPVLLEQRWENIRTLRLRGVSLRFLCILGETPIMAMPPPPMPRLAHLTLNYVAFEPGWLAGFPALRSLSLSVDFFVKNYASTLACAMEALSTATQLTALHLSGAGIVLHDRYMHGFDGPVQAALKRASAHPVVSAPLLRHFSNTGGHMGGLAVDAPLLTARLEESTMQPWLLPKIGPAAERTLNTLAWKTPSILLDHISRFAHLQHLDLGILVYHTTPDLALRKLSVLPPGLETLQLSVGMEDFDATTPVDWPPDPLAHLSALKTLGLKLSFPPPGTENLLDHLLGALPQASVELTCTKSRCADLRNELFTMLLVADEDGEEVLELEEAIIEATWDPAEFESCIDRLRQRGLAVSFKGQWVHSE